MRRLLLAIVCFWISSSTAHRGRKNSELTQCREDIDELQRELDKYKALYEPHGHHHHGGHHSHHHHHHHNYHCHSHNHKEMHFTGASLVPVPDFYGYEDFKGPISSTELNFCVGRSFLVTGKLGYSNEYLEVVWRNKNKPDEGFMLELTNDGHYMKMHWITRTPKDKGFISRKVFVDKSRLTTFLPGNKFTLKIVITEKDLEFYLNSSLYMTDVNDKKIEEMNTFGICSYKSSAFPDITEVALL